MILDDFRLTDQVAVVTDVMKEDDLGQLVDTTVTHFGKLSILVNNAGGTLPRASMQTSSRYFTTAVQFNALARTQFESNTTMGRIGKPRDIAAAALYLASPASSWVTGIILRVDGGTTSPSFEIPAPPIQPREAGTHDGQQ